MRRPHRYDVYKNGPDAEVRAWTQGVLFEESARAQVFQLATMPIIRGPIAVMPDVHAGLGSTVGTVFATQDAVIPAAVGQDIGCGMIAARTGLREADIADAEVLRNIRATIEAVVPHGRTDNGGANDRGAWRHPPSRVQEAWRLLEPGYLNLLEARPRLAHGFPVEQLGTLGSGNHFLEVSVDEQRRVWVVLHSGSRGPGARIGQQFVKEAKAEAALRGVTLPHPDLAYLPLDSGGDEYLAALDWAQEYALRSRLLMLVIALDALGVLLFHPELAGPVEIVHCVHNFAAWEEHSGERFLVTRKGAVRARAGELVIIPGAMGARSFIARGLGNPDSWESCSHGAGRAMSRTAARKTFTVEDHASATASLECRKDAKVVDETPGAYKPIDAVMAAQADLVEVVHTLRALVCVKG